MLWDELSTHFPAEVASAAIPIFRALPGATPSSAPLNEVLRRLLPPAIRVSAEAFPPGTGLPIGGFIQWLADFYANRWDSTLGESSEFAQLLRALSGKPLDATSDSADPEDWAVCLPDSNR